MVVVFDGFSIKVVLSKKNPLTVCGTMTLHIEFNVG